MHCVLAAITVKNNGAKPINLRHLSPGTVHTRSGVYQLNSTLNNNPLAIRPNGVYQFWLQPDDGTQASMSRKPVLQPHVATKKTLLDITVVDNTGSNYPLKTQVVQAVI